jgi:hypothetical protein
VLTLNQALVIKTGRVQPPWRASQLASSSAVRPFSLRALINAVGNQRVLIFVQVRDLAILGNYKTAEALNEAWAGLIPNSSTFQSSLKLISELLPPGSSIIYVSTDGQTIGISGTFNALSGITGVALNQQQIDQRTKGLEDIAQGLGLDAAAVGTLAAAMIEGASGIAELSILIAAGLAFIGAGLLLGLGIGALAAFCTAVTTTATVSSQQNGSQDVPVVGSIPPELLPESDDEAINQLLLQLAYSQMTDVPDPGTLPGAGDLVPGAPAELDGSGPGDGEPGDGEPGEAAG